MITVKCIQKQAKGLIEYVMAVIFMNENGFLVTELEQLEDIRYLEASYLENFFEDCKIGLNI